MTKDELILTAWDLKSLLALMSAVDSENEEALVEMPNVATVALTIAEKLYCHIVDNME